MNHQICTRALRRFQLILCYMAQVLSFQDHTAIDFSITQVEPNDALDVGSAELPLIAALLAEQAKMKDHERQPTNFGFATFEFDKLPFIVETSGAWSVKHPMGANQSSTVTRQL